MMDDFRYSPLDRERQEIRLLELLPGQDVEEIKCNIKHVSLEDKPLYEAISYVWGDDTSSIDILCDNRRLAITKSIRSALYGLRCDTKSRVLWADSICINQSDIGEKNQQVLLMRLIYQQCQRVLVWLDEEANQNEMAMRLVSKLSTAKLMQEQSRVTPGINMFDGREMEKYGIPSIFNPHAYPALLELLKQPWFKRAWIVQEVAVSPDTKILWGSSATADWKDLVQALRFGKEFKLPFAFHPAFGAVFAIEEERERVAQGCSRDDLLQLLLRQRRCLATDARDKVYAFAGLIDYSIQEELKVEPDYGLELEHVYTELAVKVLKHSRSLEILSVPVLPPFWRRADLPSWVPDWSISYTIPSLTEWERVSGDQLVQPFQAAGNFTSSPDFAQFSRQDKYLRLGIEGHVFDQIILVGRTCQAFPLPQSLKEVWVTVKSYFDHQRLLAEWEDIANARSRAKYVTGEEILDAYWQTMIAGNITEREGYPAARKKLQQWDRVARPPSLLYKLHLDFLQVFYVLFLLILSFVVLRRPVAEAILGRFAIVTDRRLVRTKKGYLGLASCSTEEGDLVGLFKGSKVPLVIRKEGIWWRLVGDSYVHGIMDGKAFKEDECIRMWFI